MILLLLCVFIFYILYILYSINLDKQNESLVKLNFDEETNDLAKKNCNLEMVYSLSDTYCNSICENGSHFYSHNGICKNILNRKDEDMIDNICHPKQGVLGYLVGDTQLGKANIMCLTVDLGIQPDNPSTGTNQFCLNGTMEPEINYLNKYPELSDCKCPEDHILITIPATRVVRKHGICVNKNLKPIYNYNNSIYEKFHYY